jgi:hypothetical protein
MPVTVTSLYVISATYLRGDDRKIFGLHVAGLLYYQTTGVFFAWAAYYTPHSRDGWTHAIALLSGAYFAILVYASWAVMVSCGIAMVFGN